MPRVAAIALIPLVVGCELLVGPIDGHKLFPGESEASAPPPADGSGGNGDASTATEPEAGEDAPADTGANTPDADAGTAMDAPMDAAPSIPGIRCGSIRCTGTDEVCCETTIAPDGSACVPSAQCNPPSYTFFCSTTSHCAAPSPFCCANVQYTTTGGPSGQIEGAECAPTCPAGSYGKVTLCDPSDRASLAQCASLDAGCLQLSRAPAGYYACQ